MRDLPPGASRRTPPAEPASLRVPPGATAAGRVGVSVAQRAGLAARLTVSESSAARVRPGLYIFTAMFWPLIGGFIAFVLLAVFLGWVMDTSRHGGDADRDRH